jgi:hypothetical protein
MRPYDVLVRALNQRRAQGVRVGLGMGVNSTPAHSREGLELQPDEGHVGVHVLRTAAIVMDLLQWERAEMRYCVPGNVIVHQLLLLLQKIEEPVLYLPPNAFAVEPRTLYLEPQSWLT